MRTKFGGKSEQVFEVRIRYGKGLGKRGQALRGRFDVLAKDEPARDAKRDRMQKVANALATAGLHQDVGAVLDEMGAATSERLLSALEDRTRRMCADAEKARSSAPSDGELDPKRATFGQVAEMFFLSLERKGNSPRTIGRDRNRLRVLGSKLANTPVGAVDNKQADEAMKLVGPEGVTCRHLYEGLIFRVLKHATKIYLLDTVPLRAGFVTEQRPPSRLFQYLRADEEWQRLTCRAIPLYRRVGYGLMSREGVRPEFLTLFYWSDRVDPEARVSHIDLESGLLTH